ncbi:MAG: XdhC family protein [Planctomycetota bacterium]|jgi:xanthine dehydrogenase accessory factor
MSDVAHILETVVREVEVGHSVALCVIVATHGSTPQPAGTIVCVDQAATVTGTLGGGCVEADVRRQAHALLSAGQSKLITFALDSDFGYDDGMICGGQLDVAVCVIPPSTDIESYRETVKLLRRGHAGVLPVRIQVADGPVEYRVCLEAEPKLAIAGAGHISRILARIMVPLGFGIHVVDDRGEYANSDRFPQPVQTTVGDIAATLKQWAADANTYVVIVTRGHRHDEEALRAVLDSPAKYIGMIGSRRKIKVIFDDLRRGGATEAQLSRVHAPIGVDIGSVTTEEIALSIAAELISVRRADYRSVVEGPLRVPDGGE